MREDVRDYGAEGVKNTQDTYWINRIFQEKEKPEPKYSQKKIWLGWDKETQEEIYMDNGKATVAVLIGSRGSGKTWQIREHFGQSYRGGCKPIHLSDVKGEMQSNNYESGIQKHLMKLREGENRGPIPTKMILPYFMRSLYPNNEVPNWNHYMQYGVTDLDQGEIVDLLSGDSDSQKVLARMIGQMVEEDEITNLSQIEDQIDESDLQHLAKKSMKTRLKGIQKSSAIGDKYRQDLIQDIKGYCDKCDRPAEKDGQEECGLPTCDGEIKRKAISLNLKHWDRLDEESFMQTYVSTTIRKIINALQSSKLDENIPTHFYIDEAHVLVPDDGDPASKKEVNHLINVYRHLGVRVFMATQYPEQIDGNILRQANHFLLPWNLPPETRKKVLKEADLYSFGDAQRNTWQQRFRNLGKHEWLYISRDDKTWRYLVPGSPVQNHRE